MTFAKAVPILFTSFVYSTNVYWLVIHGIKIKPHLSVVWNWYHFVAIAILHQPRPTDSADINTRLQLRDTSSIPPMHGGFLLKLIEAEWLIHASAIEPSLVQIMAWRLVGTKPLPMMNIFDRTLRKRLLFEIHTFSFKRIHLNLSSEKWQPFCLTSWWTFHASTMGISGLILDLRPADEGRRYFVPTTLIGSVQAKN